MLCVAQLTHLRTETFDENSNEQIEEYVIAECHQRHKVQCRPVAGLIHSVEQHHIPILLRQNLQSFRTFVTAPDTKSKIIIIQTVRIGQCEIV